MSKKLASVQVFSLLSIGLLLILSSSLAISAQSVAQTNWSMFRNDSQHSGTAHIDGQIGNGTLWTFSTNGQVWSSPAVWEGKVYVGSVDQALYALNASTGTLIWSYPTAGAIYSSPAVTDGVVYVGSLDGNMYALNASTGLKLWNFLTDGPVFSSPTVEGGRVYFGSDDSSVYALDAQTGRLLWSFRTGDRVQASPALSGGKVYIGSNDTNIYAIDASSGKMVWVYTTGGYVVGSSPTVAETLVVVGCYDNNTYALDATLGTLMWYASTGYDICMQGSPAYRNGAVYTGSSHLLSSIFSSEYTSDFLQVTDYVYALDATDGAIIWSHPVGGGVWSSPAVTSTTVYVGSGDGKLYALDIHDGNFVWSYQTQGVIYSSPAIADGRIYVGSECTVYAIGSVASTVADGSGVWTMVLVGVLLVLIVTITFLVVRRRRFWRK